MAKTYTMPEDLKASSFIEKDGKYHLFVHHIQEDAQNADGVQQDGIQLEATCEGGTEPSQVKKTIKMIIFNPSESSKDHGVFATKKHLRLADACNCLKKAKVGDEVEIDWSKAAGAQIIVYLKKTEKGYMDIDRLHVYHIDDPEVNDVPKNMKAVALIKPEHRRAQMKTEANVNGNGGAKKTTTQPKQQQQLAGAGAGNGAAGGAVDLNDL